MRDLLTQYFFGAILKYFVAAGCAACFLFVTSAGAITLCPVTSEANQRAKLLFSLICFFTRNIVCIPFSY